jgi:hypothetical protein
MQMLRGGGLQDLLIMQHFDSCETTVLERHTDGFCLCFYVPVGPLVQLHQQQHRHVALKREHSFVMVHCMLLCHVTCHFSSA